MKKSQLKKIRRAKRIKKQNNISKNNKGGEKFVWLPTKVEASSSLK